MTHSVYVQYALFAWQALSMLCCCRQDGLPFSSAGSRQQMMTLCAPGAVTALSCSRCPIWVRFLSPCPALPCPALPCPALPCPVLLAPCWSPQDDGTCMAMLPHVLPVLCLTSMQDIRNNCKMRMGMAGYGFVRRRKPLCPTGSSHCWKHHIRQCISALLTVILQAGTLPSKVIPITAMINFALCMQTWQQMRPRASWYA